jgi:hypothetical protein
MDLETVESTRIPAPTSAAEPAPQPQADSPVETQMAQLDAWVLVAKVIEAGEWPEPELLEQIVAAGDSATEPLIAILESRPRGRPAESVLDPVIGLLRTLGRPAAIPALFEVVKRYTDETAEAAADALVDFGTPGFEALVELCNDPLVRGYARNFVFEAAVYAAGHDLVKRSRLAEVLRPILKERIARARDELRLKGCLAKLSPGRECLDEDEDDLEDEFDDECDYEDEEGDEQFRIFDEFDDDTIDQDFLDEDEDLGTTSVRQELHPRADDSEMDDEDDDEEIEPEIAEELAYVVGALADLADPLSRDAIITAFQDGLVDESVVDEDEVDCSYHNCAKRDGPTRIPDWLSAYREEYSARLEAQNAPPPAPRIYVPPPRYELVSPRREPVDLEPVRDIAVTAPIRNVGPKLRRNDPCWCGSGRKYKKCHLEQDTPSEPGR